MKTGQCIEYNAYYSTDTGLNFQCGIYHCWKIKNGYMTAKLVNNIYCDHKQFTNLEEALLRLRKEVVL